MLVQPLDQAIVNNVECPHSRQLIDKLLLSLYCKVIVKVDIASGKATVKEAVQICSLKALFKNSVAVKVSASEEHNSAEAIEGAFFVACTLGHGKEPDQANLEEACRCLKSETEGLFLVPLLWRASTTATFSSLLQSR